VQLYVRSQSKPILSGMTITTRLNDGVALLAATFLCLVFLVRNSL